MKPDKSKEKKMVDSGGAAWTLSNNKPSERKLSS
jgi:hypothetical protein